MRERAPSDRARRFIKKIYAESGIERRYSVLDEFNEGGADAPLFHHRDGSPKAPSTGERNAVYVREARKLIPEIARKTLAGCAGIGAEDITHVITVSCTGFFNPGPDLLVIEALGLSASVQRYHLGFMGCYAAFPALKMAAQFCDHDASANVLVICLELCSIHLKDAEDLDSIVANSVFADGAAGVIVSSGPPPAGSRGYSLDHFVCELAPEGSEDMAWDIGDRGFNIVLSKYVARIIGAGIRELMDRMYSDRPVELGSVERWAVHPGGRAILDKVESSLGLTPEQIAASRSVLSRYGNMSSATVLFVLADILHEQETVDGTRVCAMAFGPGLTVETAIMRAAVA